LALAVVSTTSRYWSAWVEKLTISGCPVPVHVATFVHVLPLVETFTL
jgi:hypothetical protein